MKAGKRGLLSLAAAVFLALNSVVPLHAQEQKPDELETAAETIPEQTSDPPETQPPASQAPADQTEAPPALTDPEQNGDDSASPPQSGADSQTNPEEAEPPASSQTNDSSDDSSDSNKPAQDASTDDSSKADDPKTDDSSTDDSTKSDTPDDSRQDDSQKDDEPEPEKLELRDQKTTLFVKSNPDDAKLSEKTDYKNNGIDLLAKANEREVTLMKAWQIDPELPKQTITFETDASILDGIEYDELEIYEVTNKDIHSTASGKKIEVKDGKIKSTFDVEPLSLLVLAALKKSDTNEVQKPKPAELAPDEEEDADPTPQASTPYPCYFYARSSDKSDNQYDSTWIGMGLGSVNGANLKDPTTLTADWNGNYMADATDIVYPDQLSQSPQSGNLFDSTFYKGYPMVFSGSGSSRKSFRFNEMGTSKPADGGQYNLHWDRLFIFNTVKMGNNWFWPSNSPTRNVYRMNGTIYMNDSFNSVTFQLRDAGASSYSSLGTVLCGSNTPMSQLNVPTTLPDTKTVNGITYNFSGWYTDAALTQPATTVTGNMTLYAAYRRDFTITYRTMTYQYHVWKTELTKTVPEGTPMKDLEFPDGLVGVDVPSMKVLSWWFTNDTFTNRESFTGTVQSDMTLYAEYLPSIPLYVNKKTNPSTLTGPFRIHLYGDANAFAPIRGDGGNRAGMVTPIAGQNETDLSLESGETAKLWVPQSQSEGGTGPVLKIRVTEDNPGGLVQYYRWGNFVDYLSRLDTDPIEVRSTSTLTIFNSPADPPAVPAYFYGQVSGSSDLYGLGEGGISGPLIYPASDALVNFDYQTTSITNDVSSLVTKYTDPSSYADLTIDGKTYSYGLPTSPGASGNYYTLQWKDPVTLENSVLPGVNNAFTASNTRNYRRMADITLHSYSTFTLTSNNVNGTGDANPDDEITYRVQFAPNGITDPIIAPTGANITHHNVNEYEITLKSGQSVTFSVPDGVNVRVNDQVDQSAYTPSWTATNNQGTTSGTNSSVADTTIRGPTSVTFSNAKILIVPTAYETPESFPWALLAFLLIALLLPVLFQKRKKI